MRKLLQTLLAIFFITNLNGCQISYVVKSGYNQLKMLSQRESIREALKNKNLDSKVRRQLELTLDVKQFAENTLALEKTKSYLTYVELNRPYVTYVVNAAEKWKLEAHEWWFPIVGHVPYKGYFDKKDAEKEEKWLAQKNLDTYLRGVSAYSTLGWFNDPLYSSMLKYSDHDLVNTLIHETVHATIYIKSASEFNERVATFLGDKGAELYYQQREGHDSATAKRIQAESHDTFIFSKFITDETDLLKTWYKENAGKQLDETVRQQKFQGIKDRFTKDILPRLKTDLYEHFAKRKVNNAYLLQFNLYVGSLEDFETLYRGLGSDYKKTVAFLKSLEKEKDPEKAFQEKIKILKP